MIRATYRLQLHPGFTFADATALVPYLAGLGISHLYLSPILTSAAGSTHGYDVVDPDRVDPELGGEDGFQQLVSAVKAASMGIVLDIVPNHMSIANAQNKWWLDVLENGPSSYYAHYFDVDWSGDDRIQLPVLGERYGRALTSGTLRLSHDGAGVVHVRAHDRQFPIAPRSLGGIVRKAGERVGHVELSFIGDALCDLPRPNQREAEARRRRHRDKGVLARRLAELCGDAACARALDAEIAALNADAIELDAVLEQQNYRLVHWTVSSSQMGYRRFFDITSLVGMRIEEPDVFAAIHARVLGWLADGTIDGVRVDHVDGLRDPGAYLVELRRHAPWIVVEKILAEGEHLPPWPVEGTTGYDTIALLSGLFVHPDGETALTRTFERETGETWDVPAMRRAARKEVMSDALHGEIARLTELAAHACAASPACRDYTRTEIEAALVEIFAGYPVYRTYGREGDVPIVERAVSAAAGPEVDGDLLAFLDSALTFELGNPDARELALQAQQVTGAIVAKGDEDTLAYRAVRLLARDEVGADPATFAIAPATAHAALALSRGLNATSTHDTKRGEDVRARIAALSEIPAQWDAAVVRWRARAERHWPAGDPAIQLVAWQTMVGAWPLPVERAKAYVLKAAREARRRTCWRRPDEAYENALARWVDGVYGDRELLDDVGRLVAHVRPLGDANALAQTLIKLVAPGVPDIYQGCEIRDDSLVDPDNRRAVDYGARRTLLARLDREGPGGDLDSRKLWTIRRVLGLRPELLSGEYMPIIARGPHADHVFAFARGEDLVAVVPRLTGSANGWADTTLALTGAWREVLTDRRLAATIAVGELLSGFPIALLERTP